MILQPTTEISRIPREHDGLWADFYDQKRREIRAEILRRTDIATRCHEDVKAQAACLEMCAADPVVFFNDWLWTYDPRNASLDLPVVVPFTLREVQEELIRWLEDREETQTSGLIEKSRGEGMSYIVLGYFLHHWFFVDGFAAGIGSRKEELVDRLGDPKSLFWKLRSMLYALPDWFIPEGFNRKRDDNYLRIINPQNAASITGEGGDNMGRGGRSTIYFIDEWAYVDRQELVEAATSQNANVRIKGSTPRGIGERFYQDRFSGKYPVFTMSWRRNPDKNWTATRLVAEGIEETYYPWYEKQTAELDPVTIAQEIDIDYAASAEGVVIPAKWVQAAIGLELAEGSVNRSGLDVSEDGGDKTVYCNRRGGFVASIREIRGATANEKGSNVIDLARTDGIQELIYDRLGVGAGITASVKIQEEDLPFSVTGVANSLNPSTNAFEDQPETVNWHRFANAAAENWWALRLRFMRTYERVEYGKEHPDEDCISIPNDPNLIAQLPQPTYKKNSKDKIVVNKKGNGAASPDYAESLLYAFWLTTPRVSGVGFTAAF